MPDTLAFAMRIHSEGLVACDGTACPNDCPVCNHHNKENQP